MLLRGSNNVNIAWLTDLHLDFLTPDQIRELLASLANIDPEGIIITGDIAQANSVASFLNRFSDKLSCPIYFILGNHDYYHGSIFDVRSKITELCQQKRNLIWLSDSGVHPFGADSAIIGHDSWADGRYGDYDRSAVELTDFYVIKELKGISKAERLFRMQILAQEAVDHFQDFLPEALGKYDHILLAIHVPPFREACRFQGRESDPYSLPFFSSKVMGDLLSETAARHPDRRLTVLCGHVHEAYDFKPLPNLEIRVGFAEYGDLPRIESI